MGRSSMPCMGEEIDNRGALAGLAMGIVLTGVGVLRNEGARARLVDRIQARLARSHHRERERNHD